MALLSRAAHPLHAPGGLERAVYALAHHLEARGVETLLFTRPPTEIGAAFPGQTRIVAYGALPGIAHGRVLDRTLLYPRFSARMGWQVAAEVAAGKLDLVHAQGLTALGYGRCRRRDRRLRAPLVMNPQGMEELKASGLKRLALRRLARLSVEAARLADRVIATDQATRAELETLLRVPPERIAVLPNGIDPDAIAAATPSDPVALVHAAWPALARAEPIFLSVGRLEAYKGFGDLLAAFAQARASLPDGFRWVVVGDGPLRATLERDGARVLGSHLLLVGRVDEPQLHALYARADTFVHASRYEGSSLVTLEAMAHGLPVLATRAGGIPDKVTDGVSGRLVPVGDVAALAAGLRELAALGAQRRVWGGRGRARAHAEFAWPVLAERTLELYRELLAEGPA